MLLSVNSLSEVDHAGVLTIFIPVFLDLLAEVRVSDLDEVLSPDVERHTEEIYCAVLGNYPVNVLSCGGDGSSGAEAGSVIDASV